MWKKIARIEGALVKKIRLSVLLSTLFNTPHKSSFLAFSLGFFGALCFAPLYWWPLLGISLFGLLKLLESQKLTHGLWLFFLWSCGFFSLSFHWICLSLATDIKNFWFLIPLGLLGIPLAIAALHAGILALALTFFRITHLKGWRFFLAFLLSWHCGEYAREHFLGFPWNFIGHIWGHCPPLMQNVSLWGFHTLSFLSLALLSLPILLSEEPLEKKNLKKLLPISALPLLFLGLFFWGKHRIKEPLGSHPRSLVRLVQPNMPPLLKHAPDQQKKNFETLLALSKQNVTESFHLIWPETALTYAGNHLDKHILRSILKPRKSFITGYTRHQKSDHWNSVASIGRYGQLWGFYDKRKRAPFGEYIPGRHFLENFLSKAHIRTITFQTGDFAAGKEKKVLQARGLPPFIPLICFDTSFSDAALLPGKKAEWILELTNDVWFGKSWALDQHLDHGRFRALEAGLPLLRCTNTGISAVISAYGTVLKSIPAHTPGYLETLIPHATPKTLYTSLGNKLLYSLLFAITLALISVERRKKKSSVASNKPKAKKK